MLCREMAVGESPSKTVFAFVASEPGGRKPLCG